MSLKTNLYCLIKKGEIMRFNVTNNRKTYEPAKYALVLIMLTGINVNWKQPIAYFLVSSSCTGYELQDFIISTIIKIQSTSLDIKPFITNMGSNFVASAITLYYGKKHEKTEDWIREVERISNHAHWTESLTLVNAVSRLRPPFKMQQSDRVSLILEGITDNIWAVPLTTTKQIHRFNQTIDKKEDQICFKCKSKGHISYDCKSDKSNTKEKSNVVYKNKSTTDNHYSKVENHSNKDTNSKNKSINLSQIPVTIDALPDNGSFVTLLRKYFIPNNVVIHPWQDGSYATPDGDCTPCGWISLRIQVGKIDYTMPKVGLYWQSAVHATIIIEPNGAIYIYYSYFYSRVRLFQNEHYVDIFSIPEAEIGEFPNLEMEINLTEHKPFRCKPYRPFHVSTPKRIVIDYSRTNPVTIKDPFPIDKMDEMIKKLAGKKYISIVDIKQAFNNIKIKEEDIYKTAAVTPDHHIEFSRIIFAYGNLQTIGLTKYYDDIDDGHDLFEDLLDFLHKHFEATRKHKLKFTRQKCNFAVQKVKLLGRILDEDGDHPDPNRIKSVQRYKILDTIHEVRSFLGFANTLRRYIKKFAVISSFLLNVLKKSVQIIPNTPLVYISGSLHLSIMTISLNKIYRLKKRRNSNIIM
ncbi:hypothetical protein QTP88_012317 [Uroleucon formosanum]